MTDPIIAKLAARGLALPESCPPRALFRPWRRTGALLILAGQVNDVAGTPVPQGLVGREVTIEAAQAAAVVCVLNLLFHVADACGGRLDRVRCWLRLGGFVAAEPGFAEAPLVINAASDLLIALYGDTGQHARTAVAVAGLPGGAPVEIDALLEVD